MRLHVFTFGVMVAAMGVSGCSDASPVTQTDDPMTALCQTLQADVIVGAVKDGIPALTDPALVPAADPSVDYLLPTDRVIGVELDGEYLAFPHNILWWHEIVNLNDFGLAVTYCPLTGSSMVFDRTAADGAEFGVSGLLFKNNLVMYDRSPDGVVESLWPQMLAGARCGHAEGRTLTMVPALEIEWEDWLALHPDTRVLSGDTGFPRDYTQYPYGAYEVEDNDWTLAPLASLDDRRPPKERVLGIPFEDGGGIAFPFGALRGLGDLAAVHERLGSGQEVSGSQEPVVVFWDSGAAAAMAYLPAVAGWDLTFEIRDGAFQDLETGSRWSIEGKALSGPLAGESLPKISEAYVSFWFAFSTFFPNPVLWLP